MAVLEYFAVNYVVILIVRSCFWGLFLGFKAWRRNTR